MIKAFIIFLLISTSGFTQSDAPFVEAVYGKILLTDRVDPTLLKDPNVAAQIASMSKSFQKLHYTLSSNGTASIFQHPSRMANDGSSLNKRAIGKGGGNGIYYMNFANDELLHQTVLFNKEFRVQFPIPRYDWVLHEKTKVIKGYTCYRATATVQIDDFRGKKKRYVEAWYAPALPPILGPADYVGLPGMVLEGGSGNIRFVLKSIKTVKKKRNIQRPVDGELVSKEKFTEIFNTKMNTLIGK